MSKFYKVIKDHPIWEVGAIISTERGNNYYPIDDIWTKTDARGNDFQDDNGDPFGEATNIVENQPEWFERVYKVKLLGAARYLSRAKAKEAHDELYKS